MCGICGMFGNTDSATVALMNGTLHHRGPDDAHLVGHEGFAFGVRRLSIVDVAHGRQPVANEDETIWAAQNGELYNFPVLRPQLVARGHQLRSYADTEVLPHLYEDFGTDVPKHIDGMFAIAIWDARRKVGLLARDRMGKKPLYYCRLGDTVHFASELKALLKIPGFTRTINLEALHHYLSFKHVPHPQTIFNGVYMLPPAHQMVIAPGKAPVISRYWEPDFSVDAALAAAPEQELVDEFLRLFKQGVQRRLMSDVPIGFFLSGGLDSSLSTAVAAEMSGRIKTFTLTYASGSTTTGKEADRKWASFVAQKYGTEHHEESIEFSNYPAHLRRILGSFDEPFAGVISSYFLSQLISKHVKVAVSGDGADEIFGSYRSHRDAAQFTDGASVTAEWRAKLLVYSEAAKRELYHPDVAAALAGTSTVDLLKTTFDQVKTTDPLNRILEAEFRTILPDQILTYVDRLSMAHSLEVRSAYLDTDVVEFVGKLPGALKIRRGETKYLLKQAARRYFPAEMVDRPKEGFLMPVTEWVFGDLRPYVAETLSPDRLAAHGLFRTDRVQALVDRLSAPGADYNDVNRVMALVVFQEWYDLYMR
ncbi:MAG TPA: asparagine synthase (glutamine-hydrolyzing) [Vicinamibacterales bacterium]|nr:asparagine synthase (glutamine-hydrolyzing) [Vicinamibacterales bacterium]